MLSFQDILNLYDIVTNLNSIGQLTLSQSKKLMSYESRIRESYVSMAKRANVRLKALEDKGYTSSNAYYRATWWTNENLDRMRFSESKKLDWNAMIEQMNEINIFLQDERSTVTGEKRHRAGLDAIMPYASKKEKNQMARFLSSAAFEEMKKTIGTDIVKKAADAIEAGANVTQLNKLYKDFLKQEKKGTAEIDIIDVWSDWIGE